MCNKAKVSSFLILPALALLISILLPRVAAASFPPPINSVNLIESACSSGLEPRQALGDLKQHIVAADTVNEARKRALVPTEDALDALHNARSMIPFSDDLRNAEDRLSKFRSRILAASTQEQVADEFSGMMLAGLDNDDLANVNVGKVGCNYSTGEVIAIVIGLILGIIPGLILLVVLC